jgi:hypothetical protein
MVSRFGSLFSAKDSTVCGNEMADQPFSKPVTGPIRRTRASAANNDARQGVDDRSM